MKDGIIFLYVLKITVCNCNNLFFNRYLLGTHPGPGTVLEVRSLFVIGLRDIK